MQQRLRDIGSWLQINGEAIYGTRAWTPNGAPFPESGSAEGSGFPFIQFTRKGPDLYAHFLEWPEGEVRIDGLDRTEGLTVELLGFDGPVEWRANGRSLIFTPPLMSPRQVPSPYAYVLKISTALH
jgi:alpha-L-fucosidase